jgi:hypothetical protein
MPHPRRHGRRGRVRGLDRDRRRPRHRERRVRLRRIGLADLPIVDWPDIDDEIQQGLHWKTTFLTRWAAGCLRLAGPRDYRRQTDGGSRRTTQAGPRCIASIHTSASPKRTSR